MKKSTRFILCVVFAFCCARLFPATIEELTGDERAARIRDSAAGLTEVQLKNPAPLLLPEHDGIKSIFEEIRRGLDPSIMVETLLQYKKPQNAGSAVWSESERLGLFNQALALSTLAGIQYYSASRKAMRTFYETSWVISGADNKEIVPDPVCAAVPPSLILYARQKDLTFGDNIYRYEYRSFADAFVLIQENLTTMSAGIIPAVGKNKLRSFMAVYDCGDSLLIYAASMAKTVSLPGMGERIGNSFTNRAQAIVKWYMDKAGEVFEN